MKQRNSWMGALALVSFALALVVVSGPALAESSGAEGLERVDAVKVCMVNNTVFPRDQIPVEVDGKTYFGCCEMCKGRLAKDEAIRMAVDPVSGNQVDKATAVIGAGPDGKVQYFESEETFAKFGKGA